MTYSQVLSIVNSSHENDFILDDVIDAVYNVIDGENDVGLNAILGTPDITQYLYLNGRNDILIDMYHYASYPGMKDVIISHMERDTSFIPLPDLRCRLKGETLTCMLGATTHIVFFSHADIIYAHGTIENDHLVVGWDDVTKCSDWQEDLLRRDKIHTKTEIERIY